jgi:hypothetical protein
MLVRPVTTNIMALTMNSLLAALRRATPHQRSAFRNALGIMAPKEMTAPSVSLPYADFFKKSTKADNDAANKRRETFLATLYDADLPADAPEQLRQLHGAWQSTVKSLCPTEFATVKVNTKGSRKWNYDFLIEYFAADGTVVHTQKAEFKHGVATVEKLPQILSLAAKGLNFPLSYAEFYYDHFLARYCATDTEITAIPPSREIYLKFVHNSECKKCPFFAHLKDHEETAKEAKAALVNESIQQYLELYGDKCDVAHLTDKLLTSQKDKVFLLWDMTTFHVAHLNAENLMPLSPLGVRNGNTIAFATATHTLTLLLRWKNHKGVLYPAWQIGLAKL